MTRTAKPKPSPAAPTDPAALRLDACPWCGGCGVEPYEEGSAVPCMTCSGGGYAVVSGDLGATHTRPSRPFTFNPGARVLTVTRGKDRTRYGLVKLTGHRFPGLGVAFIKEGGGEVRHAFINANGQDHDCTCAGQTYGASRKADRRAYHAGRPVHRTNGCVHTDAAALLLAAGLLDLPLVPADLPADPPGGGPLA